MATKVIMPALGMAQETGKLLAWFKQQGETVVKGEALMEIETDKSAVEIEAAADGVLSGVMAEVGQDVPVGQVIAWILAPGEAVPDLAPAPSAGSEKEAPAAGQPATNMSMESPSTEAYRVPVEISPVARKIANEHGIDPTSIKPAGDRVQKADVLAYIHGVSSAENGAGVVLASPKARRLARERGLTLSTIPGSGPGKAVLAADVLAQVKRPRQQPSLTGAASQTSKAWAVMAERLTAAWQSIPHFYVEREVDATQMKAWRQAAQEKSSARITYTDLLIKAVAMALKQHPRVNASWDEGGIQHNADIHIGLAVAIEDGLVVPVIPHTDTLAVAEIAEKRQAMVDRALKGTFKMQDLESGTFTISNLGMYGVKRFSAIVNPPQAAILAVGTISDKAVPVEGHVEIRPTMELTLSCDHRVVDGARGARFLETLADYLEEPLGML